MTENFLFPTQQCVLDCGPLPGQDACIEESSDLSMKVSSHFRQFSKPADSFSRGRFFFFLIYREMEIGVQLCS